MILHEEELHLSKSEILILLGELGIYLEQKDEFHSIKDDFIDFYQFIEDATPESIEKFLRR